MSIVTALLTAAAPRRKMLSAERTLRLAQHLTRRADYLDKWLTRAEDEAAPPSLIALARAQARRYHDRASALLAK